LIFEHIFSPIQRTVGNIPNYFDPAHVPNDLIAWLGSWVGLTLEPSWPEARRRALIANAVPLYRYRGTPRGMREFLRLYTGCSPEITEPTLSQVSADRSLAFRFSVILRVPDPAEIDRALVEQIIELEKPAFAAYTLEIVAEQ
jgi:phage tail-like protein